MASLNEVVEAQNQIFASMLASLNEIKSSLKGQERTLQGTTAAESVVQTPDKTSPTAGKAAQGKSDAEKLADKRAKVFKGIATEAASRLSDPFEPRGLAIIDAAQGVATEQIGAGVAALAFNSAGITEERFIQQQTFQGVSGDALNLANMGIRLDPDVAKSLAQGQRAFGELAAENLKAASSASSAEAASNIAQQIGISPEAADAFGKAAGVSIADAIKIALGSNGDKSPIKSNRE